MHVNLAVHMHHHYNKKTTYEVNYIIKYVAGNRNLIILVDLMNYIKSHELHRNHKNVIKVKAGCN